MAVKFTPYLIQLIEDATLKSFWRKNALATFLRQCNVSDKELRLLGEKTKREFLSNLISNLHSSPNGQTVFSKMLYALIEQRTFPDLENWEDSEARVKNAKDSIFNLKTSYENQKKESQDFIDKENIQKRYREGQDRIGREQQSLQKLSDQLAELCKRIGTQKTGYDFEGWFYHSMRFFKITHSKPYKTDGRQIDGSITLKDTTYLVELKFTREQAGAPDVDVFHRKVSTKAENTMGIMVSMSGYSSVAIDQASHGRTILLLLDHGHLYMVLSGVVSFEFVVERLRRHASETGRSYLKGEKLLE